MGFMSAIKKMSLPVMLFKDSQGNNAPEAVNRVGNQGMQKIAKPFGFQDNPALADLPAAKTASVTTSVTEASLLKNKKKKGRYDTLLTGGKGVEGDAELGKKSLLGS